SLEVLRAQTQLKNSSTHENGYSDKPSYRPLTKFETRGLRLGHGVWDLIFTKK
ncbi:MAG: tRNA (guanosine(46)-N7)-methyltransferase TrmB, partial [Betaproteobacteria bacterium]|nr:tRNA (guanosine(46)-N7)-methyltransferase TrmB [Betaproteobacteria bacterium]